MAPILDNRCVANPNNPKLRYAAAEEKGPSGDVINLGIPIGTTTLVICSPKRRP